MQSRRPQRLRLFSPLLLTFAIGCGGSPEELESSESLASESQALQQSASALPPGLSPSLVKDIQIGLDPNRDTSVTGSWRAVPHPVVTDSGVYFTAFEESTGTELWKTDGTPEGTRLVRDLAPGPASTTLSELAAVGDTAYFLVQETDGNTLWKSDEGAEGAVPVTTSQGPVSNINNLVACDGELFFHGLNHQGSQLWKTNGTSEGTVLLSSSVWFVTYSPGAFPSSLFCANGTLYFLGYSRGTYAYELWKTDGTPEGTVKLQSVGYLMWPSVSNATYFTAVGSRVFLNTHNYSQPLWVSDGTVEGTQPISNVGWQAGTPGPAVTLPLGDKLFFTTFEWGVGNTLWTSDGTAEGTRMFRDLRGSSPSPLSVSVAGDTVLFTDQGRLFKSDGTAEGTVPLQNLTLITHNGASPGAALPDGRLLFAASTGGWWQPWQLWVSDGTEAGTTQLRTAQGQALTHASGFRRLGNQVLFWADDGVHGQEPWVTDGTPAGTRLVRDMYRPDSSHPKLLTDVDGTLFFTAFDSVRKNRGLWRSDGTLEGTVHLKEIGSGFWNEPQKLTPVGNTLYFFRDDSGLALWKSDGTPEGTVLVRELGQGFSVSGVQTAAVGSTLFFSSPGSAHGVELWKSDGTPEGTVLVKDISPGPRGSWPSHLTVVGDVLFFTADNEVQGYELWKSDGTPEGTVLVKDIYPGWIGSMSNARDLRAVGGTLFLLAMDNVHGYELWKSDGTPEGTVLVKDIRPGGIGSAIYDLAVLGNELFFTAEDGVHGRELWKTDGTSAGTLLLKELVPGAGSSFPSSWGRASFVHGVGDSLYFAANDKVHGTEPWKSDGTAEGTVLLRDVMPGPAGSGVGTSAFVPVGPHGAVAFAAASAAKGLELWMTDGTAEGTRMVADVARGALSSSPIHLTVSGPRLFFVADEGVHGRELWSVKQAAFKSR
jgi:ELWxxDGT repeat protein